MTSCLVNALGTTPELASIFSDSSVISAMVEFESALARAQIRAGVIPPDALTSYIPPSDLEDVAAEGAASATIAIPFVERLRAQSRFAHYQATSQDLQDTAMVLLLRQARLLIARYAQRMAAALRKLSADHANTPMLARTLLQPAAPVTFGLKVANWHSASWRSWKRFDARFEEALLLQFGGPVGTLGGPVASLLAEELALKCPAAPWQTQRDRLAGLLCAGAIYVATLGKVARDISLLMQSEVGEVSEGASAGGSSSMPHKRNPSGSTVALAAAVRMPGIASSFLTAMVQEQERSVGGWQAEWPLLADGVQLIGAASSAMARVVEGLQVNQAKMAANLEASGLSSKGLGAAEEFRLQIMREAEGG